MATSKQVIIVSKCLDITHPSKKDAVYHFHFKGVVAGEPIKAVLLILAPGVEAKIVKGKEYLMYCRIYENVGGTLTGEIHKIKQLDDEGTWL